MVAALSTGRSTRPEIFHVAGCRVEPSSLQVTIDGHDVRLEAKVMLVLVYLAEHAGRVVSRAELEEHLWPGRVVTEDSVTKAIAKLRRVFGDDAHNPRVIETIPKSGYRLIANTTRPGEGVAPTAAISRMATSSALWQRGHARKWIIGASLGVLLVLGFLIALDREKPGTLLSTGPVARPSVAVIPFGNFGRTPEDDYFANGITADLITDLSKLKGLLVITPQTTLTFRDSRAEAELIPPDLDADYLVIGNVQRLQEALRINVRLIETRGRKTLWAERYVVS